MVFGNNKTAAILASFTAAAVAFSCAGCMDDEEDEYEVAENEDVTDVDTAVDDSYEDQELIDDDGNTYVLHHNEDGTETAVYPDGRDVTFRRNHDNSLDFISGTAGMLAAMAAGYYLFHGLGCNTGYRGSYNPSSGRYTCSEPLRRMDMAERNKRMQSYVPSSSAASINNNYPRAMMQKDKDDQNPAAARSSSYSGSSGGGGSSSKSATSSAAASSTKSNDTATAKSNTSSEGANSTSKAAVSNSAKGGFGGAGARSATS